MKLGQIVAVVLFGGLMLTAIGNTLKRRGSKVGGVFEMVGRTMYLLWAGAVILLVAALIWLAFAMSK